jgi:site-specific recombinase XerD
MLSSARMRRSEMSNEAAGFRYLGHIRQSDLSGNGIATYLKCLKAFTRWMYKKRWIECDRFEDVKRPKFVRPKFDTLSVEQKQAILSIFNPDGFLGARNMAVFCMFVDTAVRLEELANLQAARVHLAEHVATHLGRRVRGVPGVPEPVLR